MPGRLNRRRRGWSFAALLAVLGFLPAIGSSAHAATTRWVGVAVAPGGGGYWMAAQDGSVVARGNVTNLGSLSGTHLNQPIAGIGATPTGAGYWLVATDGGIFTFGDATFLGSTGAMHLNKPIVGMAPTPTGRGYWLVASDGGIFTFGDAVFFGSTGAMHLNKPIVGMAPTPTGRGYWLVASDGGIFTFGDAVFFGSTGAMHLNKPIVGMAPSPTSRGYWLVASDGGIFTFGDAVFFGSTGAIHLNQPIVGVVASGTGHGYTLGAADASAFEFGDASSPHPQLTMYGRPGSFGSLAGQTRVSTGQTITTAGIPTWSFHPGQAAYFTAVGPNGDVLIANEPQTDNQTSPTSTDLVISVFNPRTQSFSNLSVPTTSGQLSAYSPGRSTGGADVSDLTVLPGGQVAFTSAVPYHGWDVSANGRFPTLGILNNAGGGWAFSTASSRTAEDIAASSSMGAAACPTTTDPANHPVAQCQGTNELARLPASGDFVVTEYFNDPSTGHSSGSLLVLDPTGRVVASYRYPNIPGPGGTTLSVHPREVNADPTSVAGDERFAIVFDVFPSDGASATASQPFTLQEFSFDGSSIVPRSAPIVTGDMIGSAPAGIETAKYDSTGNLWVAQSSPGTLNGGPLGVFLKSSGSRKLVSGACAARPDWATTQWMQSCPPDLDIADASALGVGRSLTEDPASHSMLLATLSGSLLPVVPISGSAIPFRALAPIDLGINSLANRAIALLSPRKGSVDPVSRTLWLPIQQLQPNCGGGCTPQNLDQWLIGVDLSQVIH